MPFYNLCDDLHKKCLSSTRCRFFPRTLLQFAKKKRKRSDSGSDVDLDVTPPSSPGAGRGGRGGGGGDDSEKRRSGRNTQRKKYVDDVDLNLSDDEGMLMQQLPPADRAAAKAVVKADAAVNASAENEKASSPAEEGAGGDDPEASNQSVPGTPAENAVINDSQSGPNYAFVVSRKNELLLLFRRSTAMSLTSYYRTQWQRTR